MDGQQLGQCGPRLSEAGSIPETCCSQVSGQVGPGGAVPTSATQRPPPGPVAWTAKKVQNQISSLNKVDATVGATVGVTVDVTVGVTVDATVTGQMSRCLSGSAPQINDVCSSKSYLLLTF